MKKLSVKKIADFIGGTVIGEDCFVTSVTTDSRKCGPQTMFVGIKGERADGNDFAEGFLKNGGACVVTQKDISVPDGRTAIRVADTKKALRDIAEYYRTTLNIEVVGVTGSVGKTSTKDMLASVLSTAFKTSATKGNYNNEIGVPLTVFDIEEDAEKAVIEMGMSNFGEISRLTKIAKPDAAVITNIGTAHIGNLGSRENILKAKLEILEGLSDGGLVILNGDDPYLWGARESIRQKTVFFGIENKEADLVGYEVSADGNSTKFFADINGKKYEFKINVAGSHHVYNALAAVLCGLRFGMKISDISDGISNFRPTGMRQKEIETGGVKIIEDCYNASADSMKSSLETLKSMRAGGRIIAVLGDMLEQGSFAEENHRLVGKYAAENRVDALVTVGNDARFIAEDAAENGLSEIYKFDKNKDAAEFLCSYLRKNDTVLLKASRGMALEEISEDIQKFFRSSAEI